MSQPVPPPASLPSASPVSLQASDPPARADEALRPEARDLCGGRRRALAMPGLEGRLSLLEWDGPAGYPAEGPALVWLHATGFHALTYRRLLIDLAAHMPVVALDQRGHGATTLPAMPGRTRVHDAYFRDAVAVLEGLGRPAVLGGHSLGCLVGFGLAGRRPDLVGGLLLAEPVLVPQRLARLFAVARAFGQADRVSRMAAGARRRRGVFPSRMAMLDSYAGRGAFRTWPAEVLADYVAGAVRGRADGQVELACSPDWEAETFNALPMRLWRWIAAIRCPITLLRGGRGSTCRAESAARLIAMKPWTREVLRPEASHFLPQELPDLVAEEVLRLTAAVAEGRTPAN